LVRAIIAVLAGQYVRELGMGAALAKLGKAGSFWMKLFVFGEYHAKNVIEEKTRRGETW
jgi:hypothetical protein